MSLGILKQRMDLFLKDSKFGPLCWRWSVYCAVRTEFLFIM